MSAHTACQETYRRGRRFGESCPYRATALVNPRYGDPFRVCGYHARGWSSDVVYPLDWSLDRIRRWQLDNLDRLVRGAS